MSPLPPFEQQPKTPEGHEKPTWLWEADPKKAEAKQENKKDKKEPKKEKEEKPKSKPEKAAEEKEPPKTPEEKRGSLIEQALELVAKHEEEPVPRDAPTLARVMIAHRVVHLYEQLQHPEQLPENTSIEAIEATLDYIVQLDEKFNDPSLEATPEIEASYNEILALAEATLREEPDLEKVVQDITHSGDASQPREASPSFDSRPQQKTDSGDQKPNPTEEEFARRRTAMEKTFAPVAAAAALIYSITHLGRKKQKKQAADSDHTFNKKEASHNTTPFSNEFSASSSTDQSPTRPSFASHHETPSVAGSNSERTRPLPPREFTPLPPRRHAAPVAAAAIATTLAARRSGEQRPTPTQLSPDYTLPLTETFPKPHSETPLAEVSPSSERKIEHMPVLQLLSLAEGISLGHGRYLRQEFEAGTIDKDGLIKILKAQSKGRDYQWEFRQQAARFAALKATSPEFLHSKKPASDSSEDTQQAVSNEANVEPPSDQSDGFEKVKAPTQPISLAPPHGDHPLLPKFTSQIQQKPRTVQRILFITAAAIASLVLIGILAGAIFAWLD